MQIFLLDFNVIALVQPVLLKKFAGSEEDKVDVQKFFGFIGLFAFLSLWWLGEWSMAFLNPFLLPSPTFMFVRIGWYKWS